MKVPRNHVTIVRLLAVVVLTLLMSSTAISGTAPSVAVLGAPASPEWNTEVQSKLMNTGLFSAVDVYGIDVVTPSLDQLLTYNSVVVYTDTGVGNPVQLGNNLADYVDAGGGVVIAVFANASVPFMGRFASDNYWGIIPAFQAQGVQLTLGTIYDPGNPILAGVNSFNGGSSSYRSTGSLHPDATRVADWSDGSPLVVTRVIGSTNRADLNFYPPSSDSRSDFWDATTDGALLLGNALIFAATPAG